MRPTLKFQRYECKVWIFIPLLIPLNFRTGTQVSVLNPDSWICVFSSFIFGHCYASVVWKKDSNKILHVMHKVTSTITRMTDCSALMFSSGQCFVTLYGNCLPLVIFLFIRGHTLITTWVSKLKLSILQVSIPYLPKNFILWMLQASNRKIRLFSFWTPFSI